jgi:hypothetical protein
LKWRGFWAKDFCREKCNWNSRELTPPKYDSLFPLCTLAALLQKMLVVWEAAAGKMLDAATAVQSTGWSLLSAMLCALLICALLGAALALKPLALRVQRGHTQHTQKFPFSRLSRHFSTPTTTTTTTTTTAPTGLSEEYLKLLAQRSEKLRSEKRIECNELVQCVVDFETLEEVQEWRAQVRAWHVVV